jgi:vanillate O-demethylase monooxygenase subunit
MGDADKADHALLPAVDSIGIGAEGYRHDLNPTMHLRARYQLLIDNLMDLTHISFIHSRTLPNADYVARSPAEVTETGTVLRVLRKFPRGPTDDFGKMLHPDIEGMVETSLVSEYFGPCLINAGGPYVTPVGKTHTRKLNFIHAITPETANSTHYFNGISRNFSLENDELSAGMLAQSAAVVREDIESLGALEPYADEFGDPRKEWSMQADAGAIRVRRMLSAQIRAERAP